MAKATHPNSDSVCWAGLKKGDSAALSYLYDTYVDKLFMAALRLTDDRELAKDALQEVFIQVWNYRETIGNVSHTQAYLVKILRNIIIKKLKKGAPASLLAVEDSLACPEGNREDKLISLDNDHEIDFRLNNALAALTSRQRLILKLHFYEGLSYEQIAVKLSMNYQSVNNLAFRTIRHLRSLMCVFFAIMTLISLH